MLAAVCTSKVNAVKYGCKHHLDLIYYNVLTNVAMGLL